MVPCKYPFVLALLCSCAFLQVAPAAVVFKAKDKERALAPGEEEISGNAQQLFARAQQAENAGNRRQAIRAYRQIVRRYPKDTLAPGAAFRFAKLQEEQGDFVKAAAAYRVMVEQYPKSPHFEEAIEAQFRIGEMFLGGKKLKLLGVPIRSGLDNAITIFAGIVRTAPYSKYAPRAQFNIGLANEKRGDEEAAVKAYVAVSEKYPDTPVAADAQYQIGYLWLAAARSGGRDAKAAENAKNGFQDFLARYPKSEKAPQARENLRLLDQKQTTNAFQIARFYDKQKNYKAAVFYYYDVMRQQPGSEQSDQARRRVEQLRPRVGEEVIKMAQEVPKKTAPKYTASESTGRRSSGSTPMRLSPEDVNVLPPPEYDESLPPPSSLPDAPFGDGDTSTSETDASPAPSPASESPSDT
jgi:outer membrane protein assembly factor BamD